MDMDLVIMSKDSLCLSTIGKLKEAFEKSDFSMRVGLLDWPSLSEDFQKIIKPKHEVIQIGLKAS